MFDRKRKAGYFVLEWLNICAVIYYFNFLFFFMQQDFGFGNRDNLLLAALNGLAYVPCAWFGGKFAQKRGYFSALRLGFAIMALALAVGSQLPGVASQFAIMAVWT